MNSLRAASQVAGSNPPVSVYNRWNGITPHSYVMSLEDYKALPVSIHARESRREKLSTETDVSSRFGRRLREMRLERKLTQCDMAKKFGIDRSFISDVERGKKAISLPMLEVIALGLKVSLSRLFEDL